MDWFFNFMTSLYNLVGFAMVAIVVFAIAFSVYLKHKALMIADRLQTSLEQIMAAADEKDLDAFESARQDLNEYRKQNKDFLDSLDKWMKK